MTVRWAQKKQVQVELVIFQRLSGETHFVLAIYIGTTHVIPLKNDGLRGSRSLWILQLNWRPRIIPCKLGWNVGCHGSKDMCTNRIRFSFCSFSDFSGLSLKSIASVKSTLDHTSLMNHHQAGGFKYCLCSSPIWGNNPVWLICFKGVGCNHQLVMNHHSFIQWRNFFPFHAIQGWRGLPLYLNEDEYSRNSFCLEAWRFGC